MNRNKTSQPRRPALSQPRLYRVECLDDRVLPAVTLTHGVLNIAGTAHGDNIEVDRTGNKLLVNVNGKVSQFDQSNPRTAVQKLGISAGMGNDRVSISTRVGSLASSIDGGAGDDTITGGSGNDSISGGSGNDSLNGGAGDDSLAGGTDDDTLTGGDGKDSIDGGAGENTETDSSVDSNSHDNSVNNSNAHLAGGVAAGAGKSDMTNSAQTRAIVSNQNELRLAQAIRTASTNEHLGLSARLASDTPGSSEQDGDSASESGEDQSQNDDESNENAGGENDSSESGGSGESSESGGSGESDTDGGMDDTQDGSAGDVGSGNTNSPAAQANATALVNAHGQTTVAADQATTQSEPATSRHAGRDNPVDSRSDQNAPEPSVARISVRHAKRQGHEAAIDSVLSEMFAAG